MTSSDAITYADPERRLRRLLRRLPGRMQAINPLAQKARLALGAHPGRHIADHRRVPRHPAGFRPLDAAARPHAFGRRHPALAALPRSRSRLARAAPAELVRRGGPRDGDDRLARRSRPFSLGEKARHRARARGWSEGPDEIARSPPRMMASNEAEATAWTAIPCRKSEISLSLLHDQPCASKAQDDERLSWRL